MAAMRSASVRSVLESKEEDYVGDRKEHLAGTTREAVSQLWNTIAGAGKPRKSKDKRGTSGRPALRGSRHLSELFVDGFDVEQIWYQLDLQTPKLLKAVDKQLKRMKSEAAKIDELLLKGEESTSGESEQSFESESESEEDLSDLAQPDEASLSEEDGIGSDDSEGAAEDEKEENAAELLPTEDSFFRLGEMEAFVQQAEEEYEKERMAEDGEGSDADDEVKGDDDDDEEEEDSEGSDGGFEDDDEVEYNEDKIMYNDYFKGNRRAVSVKQDAGEDADADHEEEELGDVGKAQEVENKSRQEVRSERMQRRISRLEEANMSEAHWTMKGEVKANQRPANSLLEVDLDFQHAANPPIEPTQEIADEMDEIIKTRISERRFDDVIPIVVAEAPEDARTLNGEELDDKKATKGLAEIYESEYMQARGFSDIEDKHRRKQEACWTLYRSIAARLDAMSHFQFSPKPVSQEANESQANAPAITMEEVGLEALSSAGTLAPGEVMKASSKGLLKADGEFEKEERKARRRANKKRRKAKEGNEAEEGQGKQKMGRKSAELEQQRKKSKRSQDSTDLNDKKVRYSKSGDVFKLLQEQQEAAASQKPSGSSQRKGVRENKNALKL